MLLAGEPQAFDRRVRGYWQERSRLLAEEIEAIDRRTLGY